MNVAKKTLEVYICPIGNALEQIKSMSGNLFNWIARAKENELKIRYTQT